MLPGTSAAIFYTTQKQIVASQPSALQTIRTNDNPPLPSTGKGRHEHPTGASATRYQEKKGEKGASFSKAIQEEKVQESP
jgi:hypothetical protein